MLIAAGVREAGLTHSDFDRRTDGYVELDDLFKDAGLFGRDRRAM